MAKRVDDNQAAVWAKRLDLARRLAHELDGLCTYADRIAAVDGGAETSPDELIRARMRDRWTDPRVAEVVRRLDALAPVLNAFDASVAAEARELATRAVASCSVSIALAAATGATAPELLPYVRRALSERRSDDGSKHWPSAAVEPRPGLWVNLAKPHEDKSVQAAIVSAHALMERAEPFHDHEQAALLAVFSEVVPKGGKERKSPHKAALAAYRRLTGKIDGWRVDCVPTSGALPWIVHELSRVLGSYELVAHDRKRRGKPIPVAVVQTHTRTLRWPDDGEAAWAQWASDTLDERLADDVERSRSKHPPRR